MACESRPRAIRRQPQMYAKVLVLANLAGIDSNYDGKVILRDFTR